MIPKKIHISWKNKDILECPHPLIVNGIARLAKMNPDWTIEVSDDQDVDDYLLKCLAPEDYQIIKSLHVVPKLDIWRLCKLYNEGGLYIDIDRLCNVNLNDLISDDVEFVLPTCKEHDFSHDIMLSAPGNLVFMQAAAMSLTRRKEGHSSVYFLGPQTYMHAVTIVLMNELINTNPGAETFDRIRKTISNKFPKIKLFREEPPLNTIVYNHDGSELDHESLKRDFYAYCKVKHWTGDW